MINKVYYFFKPVIPRRLQLILRRKLILRKRLICKDIWPIEERAAKLPDNWIGWPENKQFALILTHDVDTAKGQEQCHDLIKLEENLGFRSSFNFVPKRYDVSANLRNYLTTNGFEVGVHGLYHDGKYYQSRDIFRDRAKQINKYLQEWKSVGFRTPSMLHNMEWMHDLNIDYDASTFDTDPFEPQPDGVSTIFPFWVSKRGFGHHGYVELPYTLPQDFTVFILMKENSIEIWKTKLDWIVENGGMALINTHPDYMNFGSAKLGYEEYPARYYEEFLSYIKSQYGGQYWHSLPKDASLFWKDSYSY